MKSMTIAGMAAAGMVIAANAIATEMPPLARKNNCVACHSVDKKIVGPAWMDVSKKYRNATTYTYKGTEYPLQEGLFMKVSRGGSGNWGSVPMPGNAPAVKDADIRELVQFVLSLAK
ncbi:cytochrome c-551 precursor [mine drainage metagenome]|uniref:Cytochrome c-551 n=1 Tax=mine drainage metagenome TaxID=410659 RepID=A0A1J5S6S3_9ZZZZ